MLWSRVVERISPPSRCHLQMLKPRSADFAIRLPSPSPSETAGAHPFYWPRTVNSASGWVDSLVRQINRFGNGTPSLARCHRRSFVLGGTIGQRPIDFAWCLPCYPRSLHSAWCNERRSASDHAIPNFTFHRGAPHDLSTKLLAYRHFRH